MQRYSTSFEPDQDTETLQGIILKSQLYAYHGHAADSSTKVSDSELKDPGNAIILAKAVYKTDSLCKVNKISEEFNDLLWCIRSEEEK